MCGRAEDLSVLAEVAQADTHERDGARLLHGACSKWDRGGGDGIIVGGKVVCWRR